jgi:integrase
MGEHRPPGQTQAGHLCLSVLYTLQGRKAIALCPDLQAQRSATNPINASVDLVLVAGILGHSSVQTTARYDQRREQAKKRAARSLHVPYSNGK